MQRKYAPGDRLTPIAEDSELGIEEALEAETHQAEHLEVTIHNAKPRQHSDVRNEIGQGKCIPKINTPSVILEKSGRDMDQAWWELCRNCSSCNRNKQSCVLEQ